MAGPLPLRPGAYTIPRGQIIGRPVGQAHFERLGDTNGFSLEISTERARRYRRDSPTRVLGASSVTQIEASISFSLVQWHARARSWSVMSDLGWLTQANQSSMTTTVDSPKQGQVIRLGAVDVTVGSGGTFDDSGGTTWTEGTNYYVDSAAGLVMIGAPPDGAASSIDIPWTAPEITDTAERAELGIGSNVDLDLELLVRGVNTQGVRSMLHLHRVAISSDGRPYISESDDYEALEYSGDVINDVTQPAGFELGREIDLA